MRFRVYICVILVKLLCVASFAAVSCSYVEIDGSFSGAEYDYLTLNGVKYELCHDNDRIIRGEFIGTLPYGNETARIYRAVSTNDDNKSEYLYVLTFRDGDCYKKVEAEP